MDEETSSDISQSDPVENQEVDQKKPKGAGAVVLGAAMIAMGEILEPEKTKANYWINAFLVNDRKERDKLLKYTNNNNKHFILSSIFYCY